MECMYLPTIPARFTFLLCFFTYLYLPSPPPYFPSHHPSSGLSLCWNHTCAFHTSRHTGETYAGWNMVRELCWISLAKRVVINRMTYGNNYQPSSLHLSFPPSFSSLTHPSLLSLPFPLSFSNCFLVRIEEEIEEKERRERGSWG